MTIETKYNIGDEVWLMRYNKPEPVKVKYISIHVSNDGVIMKFAVVRQNKEELHNMVLSELFPTKQDLLNSL